MDWVDPLTSVDVDSLLSVDPPFLAPEELVVSSDSYIMTTMPMSIGNES